MVNYNPRVWLSLIFHSYGRTVMRILAPVLIMFIIFTSAVCYVLIEIVHFDEMRHFTINHTLHSLLGVVLGLFLVFRINSAYDRWWEGRRQWGQLVNSTRNLSIKLSAMLPPDDLKNRKWFSVMIPNLAASLHDHLKTGTHLNKPEPVGDNFSDSLKNFKHIPNGLSLKIYDRIMDLHRNQTLSGYQLLMLERELKDFSDIIGACERIKYTPIPYSYMMYIKQFIFLYSVTLPFAFVSTAGYFTIPIVMLTTFVVFSVELIAEEIEDPFGNDLNDLPTASLTRKIRENVSEILFSTEPDAELPAGRSAEADLYMPVNTGRSS